MTSKTRNAETETTETCFSCEGTGKVESANCFSFPPRLVKCPTCKGHKTIIRIVRK